jgi:hypothetical protein
MATPVNRQLGSIRPVVNANQVVRKNRIATMQQNGAIIPFYNMFRAPLNGTTPPPAAWLTRR